MKSIFRLSTLLTLLFWVFLLGCKKAPEDTTTPVTPVTPVTGTEIPKVNMIAWVTDTKRDLGLLINDPDQNRQLAAFGNKDSAGDLVDIRYILCVNPAKQIWLIYELDSDHTPKSVRTSTGHLLTISNFDRVSKTFSVTITEYAIGKELLKKSKIAIDDNAFLSVDALKKLSANGLRGGRLASGTRKRSVTAAEYAAVAANVFGCVMGAGALAGEIGAGGVGLALVPLTAYNTYNNCKGVYDALKNFQDGQPLVTCMSANDVIGSATSYAESLVGLMQGVGQAGNLANFATGVIPQAISNAIQGPKGLCDPDDPAHSTGDPHLTSLDGLRYDFQGHGEFIALKSTSDNFEVQVRQESVNNSETATMNTAVAIQTGTDVVCVTVKPDRLFINNQSKDLTTLTSLTLAGGAAISKTKDSGYDVLNVRHKNGDLVKVRFHGSYLLDYSLYLSDSRKDKVFGLMGNYDGNKDNDVQVRNGKVLSGQASLKFEEMYPTFADSWRITQANSLFYYDAGKNIDTYTKKDFPKEPVTLTSDQKSKAEAICRAAGVTSEPFLSGCIMDVALTGDASLASSSLWGQTFDTRPAGIPLPVISEAISVKRITYLNTSTFLLKPDGTLWAAGWSNKGMFGIGKNYHEVESSKGFIQIMSDIKDIASGHDASHMLFLKNDNTVWAAGYNSEGQVGNGSTDGNSVLTAVKIMNDGQALAVGDYNSFVIKTDNSLWAFGQNDGRLGDGTKASRFSPVRITDNVKAVAAGSYTTLILKTDNTLWGMGAKLWGTFGMPQSTEYFLTPGKLMDNVQAIASGNQHSLVLKTDNTLWVSGNNSVGQLGLGTVGIGATVYQFTKAADNVRAVAAGNHHSLILKTDNTLWATGGNKVGQFGNGNQTDRNTFGQVMSGVSYVATGGGNEASTFIIKTDNTLWATGDNLAGQLGFASPPNQVSTFVPIVVK
ncbi:hypothetical protein GCM10028807_47070 [Spirosoma daeguense]